MEINNDKKTLSFMNDRMCTCMKEKHRLHESVQTEQYQHLEEYQMSSRAAYESLTPLASINWKGRGFRGGLVAIYFLAVDGSNSKDNCVKSNKDRPILSNQTLNECKRKYGV